MTITVITGVNKGTVVVNVSSSLGSIIVATATAAAGADAPSGAFVENVGTLPW